MSSGLWFSIAFSAVVGACGEWDVETCSQYGVYNSSFMLANLWDTLSGAQKGILRTCGYDEITYEGPSDCYACFSDLGEAQQKAMLDLGTDADCNDRSLNQQGFNCTRTTPPADLKRPQGVSCDATSGLLNTSLAAVNVPWKDLTPKLRQSATTCGYSKKSWDGPLECRACFSDLSLLKQDAVMAFGTDEECWNRQFEVWGIDCNRLVKSSASASERSALYAGLSKMVQQKFRLYSAASLHGSQRNHSLSGVQFLAVVMIAVSMMLVVPLLSMKAAKKGALDDREAEKQMQDSSHEYVLVPLDESDVE